MDPMTQVFALFPSRELFWELTFTDNPKNWTLRHKWAATIIGNFERFSWSRTFRLTWNVVSSFTFISPVSSSMVAPAVNAIARQFDITSTVEQELTLSSFVSEFHWFLGHMANLGRFLLMQSVHCFLVRSQRCMVESLSCK